MSVQELLNRSTRFIFCPPCIDEMRAFLIAGITRASGTVIELQAKLFLFRV
jgi:hypothetical protein